MSKILALLPDPAMRARLHGALDARHCRLMHFDLCIVGDWAEMRNTAFRTAAPLAVFDPYTSGALDLDSVIGFHARFPMTALVAYGNFGGHCHRDVVRLLHSGVREFVFHQTEDAPGAFCDLLIGALRAGLEDEVRAGIGDLVPPDLENFFGKLLGAAHQPLTPAGAARLYHRHAGTLRSHLRGAGLPPLEKMIVWVRLFHVAYRLQQSDGRAEEAIATLGFSSASALRNQLRGYAGLNVRQLRARGGLAVLLEAFRERHRVEDWALNRDQETG